MLTDISWSQFFLTAGAALALYYLAVLLRFYRHDIKRQLTRTFHRAGLPADRPSHPQASILGAAFPEAVPSLSSASNLQVALSPAGAALLAEVGSLLETAAETRMGKAKLLSLLRLLDECHLPAAEDRLAVQRYLLEHGPDKLSFSLTAADLSPTEHRPAPHTETATHS